MPEGRRPRGATPDPRSGAVAESARLQQRRSSQDELPHIRGQGLQPGGATPRPRSRWLCFTGAAIKRNQSKTVGEARGHQKADTLKP